MADARSDIFAFGLVLYKMLTGKRAFEGASAASVIAAILERPAPSVAAVAPSALNRLLQRCLAKDPDERWQSARDVKAALDLIVEPAVCRYQPAPTRSARQRTLGPWLVAGVMAAGLAALAFVHFREIRARTAARAICDFQWGRRRSNDGADCFRLTAGTSPLSRRVEWVQRRSGCAGWIRWTAGRCRGRRTCLETYSGRQTVGASRSWQTTT